MWIIGLLVGLVVGEIIDHGDGAVFGAAIGAIAGMLFSVMRRTRAMNDLHEQIRSLEERLTAVQRHIGMIGKASSVSETLKTTTVRTAPVEAASDQLAQDHTSPAASEPLDTPATPASPSAQPAQTYTTEPSGATAHSAAAQVYARTATNSERQSQQSGGARPPSGGDEITRLWKWLSGGNALVRVGVVVLFFGVAFLLKYAYEHTHIPIELRLTGVAIGAIVMLVIGWRLRTRNPVYALAIQGGGTGVLYLVVFGAFRLFKLLPGEAAFILLIAIAVLSAILAIVQNAQSLAVLAVSGGFLAPILASTGGGSHVMLFSYYAVLNLGILAIALYKAWRPLNVLGFVFTFAIGSMWGARFYRDDMFASTEPFLIFFTLLYILIAVIFAFRQAPRLKHYVDSTLIFGTP
ncbi:MAG: DUF2339 domain-containing protein, partial [Burkholderiales bacterium]